MLMHTKEQYFQVMQLRKQSLGAKRISMLINVPKPTIDGWLYRDKKPRIISEKYRKSQEENKKYLTGGGWNKKRFPLTARKLSLDLSYICGVILGDGYIHKNRGRIELLVKDKDFAEKFAKAIKNWCDIEPKMHERRGKYFSVVLFSINARNFLKNNIKNLVKQIERVQNEKIICAFLRGIFDSEGTASYNKNAGRFCLNMRITNKKTAILTRLLLYRIGIHSNFYIKSRPNENWKTCYEIAIQKRQMQKIFFEKVGFSISRKQRTLEEVYRSEFLEHRYAHHHWYSKSEIETINRYYNSVRTKKLANILNSGFWNGRNIRNASGIYTKVHELRKVNRW